MVKQSTDEVGKKQTTIDDDEVAMKETTIDENEIKQTTAAVKVGRKQTTEHGNETKTTITKDEDESEQSNTI